MIGVYGLSVLTLGAMAAPAALVDSRPAFGANGGLAMRAAPCVLAALIFGVVWSWGAQRLSQDDQSRSQGPVVRLIDVGAPQAEKFSHHTLVLQRYLELMGPDRPGEPDIVIWPEGALPYLLLQDPNALDIVTAALGDRKLIVGTIFEDRREVPKRVYNALAVLSADSSTRSAEQIYYKHRLVPLWRAGAISGAGVSHRHHCAAAIGDGWVLCRAVPEPPGSSRHAAILADDLL